MVSLNWMYNCVADFETDIDNYAKNPVVWKKCQWRHPLAAMTKIEIKKKDEKVCLVILFDGDKQNTILKEKKEKLMKKNKRDLLFADLATCRDFIFHLRRLHHLHNFVMQNNDTAPLEIEDNFLKK